MKTPPTLRCPCAHCFVETAVEYATPPAGETPFDLRGNRYYRAYDRCGACSHWFGRTELDLSALYDHAYVDSTYGGRDGMRRRFDFVMSLPPERSDNRQRVARVRQFAIGRGVSESARPTLLDIGAGLGVFPAVMAAAGWDVTATEPDPRTVEHLEQVAGVRAIAVDLLTWSGPVGAAGYDAVTFNKVLEHVEDPVMLLAAAARLMAPGGFVYVEVPDVAAADAGPGREEFFLEHLHVFSPASVVMLGERSGLRVVECERLRESSGKFTLRAFFVASTVADVGEQ